MRQNGEAEGVPPDHPLARKVETDERRFITKIQTLKKREEPQCGNRNIEKVKKHARRVLWLLENDNAR